MDRLVVVDGANVVGSVPDGWWRDRGAATTRLRDALARRPDDVLSGDMVLVVEGAARDVPEVPGVRVVVAPGSGDDAIVDLVREAAGTRECLVVTTDRGLRDRVRELGAAVVGAGEARASLGMRTR
jgi:hypothetical protein